VRVFERPAGFVEASVSVTLNGFDGLVHIDFPAPPNPHWREPRSAKLFSVLLKLPDNLLRRPTTQTFMIGAMIPNPPEQVSPNGIVENDA
jgi:hypothetical protein